MPSLPILDGLLNKFIMYRSPYFKLLDRDSNFGAQQIGYGLSTRKVFLCKYPLLSEMAK